MATAVKVSDDLFEKAKIKSKVFKRSIAGQIEYWAKIGIGINKTITINPKIKNFMMNLLYSYYLGNQAQNQV